MPVGMGMAVPAMTTGILSSVDKSLSGTASAVLNIIRQTGGAIGVATFGALAAGGPATLLAAIPLIAGVAIVLIVLTIILMLRYANIELAKHLKNSKALFCALAPIATPGNNTYSAHSYTCRT